MKTNAKMTDDERRKVFWLLKKYSSYTAWKALAEAYYAFADAWMVAMRKADDADIDEFNQNATKDILDGRIGFEKGLPRLKVGDRSVWRRNSRGALAKGGNEVYFIDQIMDEREYVFDWMKNRFDVQQAHIELNRCTNGLGAVTERIQVGDSAALGRTDAFDPFWGPYNFPTKLQEVPAITATIVDTGTEVLIDGIYEPEWGEIESLAGSGLLGKIKLALVGKPSLIEPAAEVIGPRREHIGCMNYLLANTPAPTYRDGELDKPWPVTWRMVWKDERYLDGLIPPEEAEYLAPVVVPASTRLRCEANQPCPREGWWLTPARENSRRLFKQGELMPEVGSDYGAVIWQWDEQQEA